MESFKKHCATFVRCEIQFWISPSLPQVAQKAQAQAQAQAAPAQCALVRKSCSGFFVNLYKKDRDYLIIRRAWEDFCIFLLKQIS